MATEVEADVTSSKLADMPVVEPDDLLKPLGNSRPVRALTIALVIHLAVIGLTSFGLYRDWGNYGIHTPAEIKLLKKQQELEKLRQQLAADNEVPAPADPGSDTRPKGSGPASPEDNATAGGGSGGDGNSGDGDPTTPPTTAGDVDPLDTFEFDDKILD